MARTSVKEREFKRLKLVAKYAQKRAALKETISSPHSTEAEVWAAQIKLQKLPRDSSPCRLSMRCQMTGRAHGVYRKFQLSRIKIREEGMKGNIPGLKKASW